MMQPDRVSLIMANLVDVLRAIPEVRGVSSEAPREDEQATPFDSTQLPHVWCWEDTEDPTPMGTGLLKCALPITIECVYPYLYDDSQRGLRAIGRRLKAQIQLVVSRDIGRGFDDEVSASVAMDTVEKPGAAIAPLPQRGFGCVHLEYEVTYVRAFNNPYSMRPSL